MASSTSLPFPPLINLSNRHNKPFHSLYTHNLSIHPPHPYLSITSNNLPRLATAINCRISGVDSGGVSDDFIFTNSFYHEFSVIANMLKKIEPLDTSDISNGVSESVKDAMTQMISTMLGLLPSDIFSVSIKVSKRPLVRLLASSLITGYTLWNAEYRIMLKRLISSDCDDAVRNQVDVNDEVCDNSVEVEYYHEELDRFNVQNCLSDLSPDAMNYIRELEKELSAAKKDLHTEKQETISIGYTRESTNDILKYLRSLDSYMVNELSRPSTSEVKQVLQQLVHNTSRRIFKEDITSSLMGDLEARLQENYQNGNEILCETRDYLAKLLFWCMLLGHQLRSVENRLYLSCAVGFL
ncbi:uncharacterized protein [Rutidosis leptorrhynchoides]|uniref:uncharacterized protein n=1 Tax=Rutidosis leptorrhynchoides TaxID=125765 RepID=UPI003A99E936